MVEWRSPKPLIKVRILVGPLMQLNQKKCVPCEVGGVALSPDEARALMEQTRHWSLVQDAKKISREFLFKNFKEALQFVNMVGDIAEEEGHHPEIYLSWGKVIVELWTHAVNGLSENDFIVAAKIDQLQT